MKYIIILIIIVILGIIYVNWRENNKTTENFSCDATTEEEAPLTLSDSQMAQLSQLASDAAQDALNANSSLQRGPAGPKGDQGVPGNDYISSGRLVNQKVSYTSNEANAFLPVLVTTRTSGTIPTQSLLLMDSPTLASFQYWYYNKNYTIQNKYDNKCINYDATKSTGSKVYMGDCTPGTTNQWTWGKNNKIVLKGSSPQKCLYINKPEDGVVTTDLPNASNTDAVIQAREKYYLQVKNCDSSDTYANELWSFI